MRKNLFWWQFAGFSFACVFGTILHFLYEWTGECVLLAPISAVNESTAEHMKIFFFPVVLFAIVQYFYYGKSYRGFWAIKLFGTITGLIFIPTAFYTFTGAFGMSVDWVNILIFFLSSASCFLLETHLFLTKSPNVSEKISIFLLILFGVLIVLFTFLTPQIPLFLDPITGNYGI